MCQRTRIRCGKMTRHQTRLDRSTTKRARPLNQALFSGFGKSRPLEQARGKNGDPQEAWPDRSPSLRREIEPKEHRVIILDWREHNKRHIYKHVPWCGTDKSKRGVRLKSLEKCSPQWLAPNPADREHPAQTQYVGVRYPPTTNCCRAPGKDHHTTTWPQVQGAIRPIYLKNVAPKNNAARPADVLGRISQDRLHGPRPTM